MQGVALEEGRKREGRMEEMNKGTKLRRPGKKEGKGVSHLDIGCVSILVPHAQA